MVAAVPNEFKLIRSLAKPVNGRQDQIPFVKARKSGRSEIPDMSGEFILQAERIIDPLISDTGGSKKFKEQVVPALELGTLQQVVLVQRKEFPDNLRFSGQI